jgi:hypothetical protein
MRLAPTIVLAGLAGCGGSQTPADPPPEVDPPPEESDFVVASDRDLYRLVERLLDEPDAQTELAPELDGLHHGETDVTRPIPNAASELSWLRGAHYVTHEELEAGEADRFETVVTCTLDRLRCHIIQAGGLTQLHFERDADGSVTLRRIESEDP